MRCCMISWIADGLNPPTTISTNLNIFSTNWFGFGWDVWIWRHWLHERCAGMMQQATTENRDTPMLTFEESFMQHSLESLNWHVVIGIFQFWQITGICTYFSYFLQWLNSTWVYSLSSLQHLWDGWILYHWTTNPVLTYEQSYLCTWERKHCWCHYCCLDIDSYSSWRNE